MLKNWQMSMIWFPNNHEKHATTPKHFTMLMLFSRK